MSYNPKVGDILEYKASDMVSGWLVGGDFKFKCRVVSLIFKAGELVGQGIVWEEEESMEPYPRPKILLTKAMFGRAATKWITKGVKV